MPTVEVMEVFASIHVDSTQEAISENWVNIMASYMADVIYSSSVHLPN